MDAGYKRFSKMPTGLIDRSALRTNTGSPMMGYFGEDCTLQRRQFLAPSIAPCTTPRIDRVGQLSARNISQVFCAPLRASSSSTERTRLPMKPLNWHCTVHFQLTVFNQLGHRCCENRTVRMAFPPLSLRATKPARLSLQGGSPAVRA
jgi:hypothetical protein